MKKGRIQSIAKKSQPITELEFKTLASSQPIAKHGAEDIKSIASAPQVSQQLKNNYVQSLK